MALLLDTHALIWYAENNEELLRHLAELISSTEACYVSRVTLWEVAIKVSIGKLSVEPDYPKWLQAVGQQFPVLEITDGHLKRLSALPHHHRNPFDRLLIAQAMSENLTLLSRDAHFSSYPVRVRWEAGPA